jgi:coenzyme F420-reducing hydrogenase beta subunit
LFKAFNGRVAVVALPCEITALFRRQELAAKTTLTVALFCGHATTPALVDRTVDRLSRGSASGLERFRFRQGHCRGRMRAEFSDGSVIERPFSEYGMYQNLYVCAAKKCMFCGDHFGYDDDVCVGDIWSAAYKADPIKHTAMILKTPIGVRALEAAESGELVAADVGIPEIRARRRGGSLARAHCSTNSIEQFPRIAVKRGS